MDAGFKLGVRYSSFIQNTQDFVLENSRIKPLLLRMQECHQHDILTRMNWTDFAPTQFNR